MLFQRFTLRATRALSRGTLVVLVVAQTDLWVKDRAWLAAAPLPTQGLRLGLVSCPRSTLFKFVGFLSSPRRGRRNTAHGVGDGEAGAGTVGLRCGVTPSPRRGRRNVAVGQARIDLPPPSTRAVSHAGPLTHGSASLHRGLYSVAPFGRWRSTDSGNELLAQGTRAACGRTVAASSFSTSDT